MLQNIPDIDRLFPRRARRVPIHTFEPGDIRHSFPASAPGTPLAPGQLLQELEQRVLPGITLVQHPMHYGWFPSNAALASVLGDIASSGLGALGISWESCPALTEVEEVVCDWMRQLTGLSENWEGCIQDTASTSCLTSMLLARERVSDYAQNHGGLQGAAKPLVVYTTVEAHSSVVKAALLAGFGSDNLRMVAMDPESHSMRAESLAEQVVTDIGNGYVPAAVVASARGMCIERSTRTEPPRRTSGLATQASSWWRRGRED